MTRSGTSDELTMDAPRAPIIILGRRDYYVAFPSSVADAVALVRPRKDGENGGEYDAVPPVEALDFFDVSGRRLEPIIVAGQLEGLALHDEQAEIRYRLDRLHHYLSTGAPRGDRPVRPRPFSDESLDFEGSIRYLAAQEAEFEAASCSWIKWAWGHC